MEDNKTDLYIDLARLLQKERHVRDQRRIEEILGEDLTLHEKIQAIRDIDSAVEESGGDSVFQEYTPFSPSSAPLNRESPDETASALAIRNRKLIKKPLRKVPYIPFVMGEFARIRSFIRRIGRNNDVLIVKYLPPGFLVNRRLSSTFQSTFIRYAVRQRSVFDRVLACAWRHLTKHDYNLIVLFRDCLNRLSSLNTRVFAQGDTHVIDMLKSFEQLYLSCLYDPSYVRLVFDCITSVSEKHPELDIDLPQSNDHLFTIFGRSGHKPLLQDVVLALNMVRYNRYLTLQELISDNLKIVPTRDFMCTDEVRERIDAYLDSQEKDLAGYLAKRNEIRKIERFLPMDDSGNVRFTILSFYYGSVRDSRVYNMEDDLQVVPLFVFRFYTMFIFFFDDLLSGRARDLHGRKISMVESEFGIYQLNRLKMLIEKLYRLKYVFKNITADRYALLCHTVKAGTSAEIEVMQAIGECTEISRLLAEHIIDRLSSFERNGAEPTEGTDEEKGTGMPLSGPDFLREKHAVHAVHDAVTLLFLAGMKLRDTHILNLLSRREKLERNIAAVRGNLERIATHERYMDFMMKHPIDLNL
ncbi:MAG: hypothetical protein ACOCWH_02380 [Spirochaetota bacterium]